MMGTLEFELLRTDLEDAIKILKFRNNQEDAEIANDIQKAIKVIQWIDNKEIIKKI